MVRRKLAGSLRCSAERLRYSWLTMTGTEGVGRSGALVDMFYVVCVPIGRRQREHRRLRATKIVCSDRAFTHVRYSPPRANRRRESALPRYDIRSRRERGDRADTFRADSNHHSHPIHSPLTAHSHPTRHRTANAQYSRWNPHQRLRARGRTLKEGQPQGTTSRASAATEASTSAALKRTNAPSQAAGCSRSHVAAFSLPSLVQSSIAALATIE